MHPPRLSTASADVGCRGYPGRVSDPQADPYAAWDPDAFAPPPDDEFAPPPEEEWMPPPEPEAPEADAPEADAAPPVDASEE